MSFKEVDIKNLSENAVKLIGEEWMLVSAGNKKDYNMMTASWGGLGEMWRKHCAICVIRPSRYTKKFVDNNEYFALSFYGDDKEIHKVCGNKSGRDTNKTMETGLTPLFADNTVYFEQARLVLICKKLYVQPMDEKCILSDAVKALYPDKEYHTAYVGEIVKTLINE